MVAYSYTESIILNSKLIVNIFYRKVGLQKK
jgi:hypothetical protein